MTTRSPRPRRVGSLALATAVPLALVATPTLAAPAGPAAAVPAAPAAPAASETPTEPGRSELGSRIGLPLLPDTQFYSRYDTPETGRQLSARYGSNPFAEQARWIGEHREELAVPMAIHLGDVVDQAGVDQEWVSAGESLAPFYAADMPFSILAGNHDVATPYREYSPTDLAGSDAGRDLTAEPYLAFMTDERRTDRATFRGTDDTGFAEYHVFEAEGQQFLQLALSWWSSPDTLAWAEQVIAEHPTMPVILSTHQNLDIEDDGVTPERTAYGEYLWENLIAGNDQIFLVLSGHHHGATSQVRTNDAGNDVLHVLSDYQMSYQGGNGYMSLLELDLTDNAIDLATFSPWVPAKPRPTLNSFDIPVLDAPNQEWSVPMDFTERFAGFNPGFGPGSADEPDLTEAAKAIVLDGWVPPTTEEHPPATDAADYPVVAGTVAHWRPGRSGYANGEVVPVGGELVDAAGSSPMTRQPLDALGAAGGEADDVTFSTDHHPLSSDAGSLAFDDTVRSGNHLSFFATTGTSPADAVAFGNGYTVEAFVRIDPAWTPDNAWMGALARGGQRSEGALHQEGEAEAPPAVLALSNLREFQWAVAAAEGDLDPASMWSHEIPRGEWMHVAIVNDPADGAVTMYVEGAPVLRNGVDNVGLNYVEGAPWVLGMAGWESKAADGWLGAIGEVRLVDRPLTADQWLTARASGTPTPGAGDIPVTAEIPGLGAPGTPGESGALVLSVAPGSVDLGDARNRGDRLALTGVLPAVTVTDTRADGGWTVTGRSSDLAGTGTAQGATVRAAHLGWAPHLVDAASAQATPGARVAPAPAGGPGLAAPARLASGSGLGSATLGADLELQVPVDTKAGGYAGALTVSLFPED